jgi:adenosylcobinamide-phosphate synthase
MVSRARAAAAGVIADMLIGEPPIRPHPLTVFGRAMAAVEGAIYRDTRRAGVLHAGAGALLGGLAGWASASTVGATYLAVAQRALSEAAGDVQVALETGDIAAARTQLRSLVGRDTEELGEKEIARAAIESVAENTVDAIVAPALWAAVGGAPAALAYRAVNTMDAVVGYRNERYGNYGWASARLDDGLNYIPARITAALVVLVRPAGRAEVWRAVRHDAPHHPSPNAGVAEAAFAAALDVRLGGTNSYAGRVEARGALGRGRDPTGVDIRRSRALSRDVTLALIAALAVAPAVTAPARRSGRR